MEFGNPIVGTEDLIRTAIKSPNYEAGVAGWIIRQDGTVEFQDAVIRGDVQANSVSVPFTNQSGEDYRVLIGPGNPDAPTIFFEYDGDGSGTNWQDGIIRMEGFEGADPHGEFTVTPLRAGFQGSSPSITLRSTRENQGGTFLISGSANIAGDRPLLSVSSSYHVSIESLRPETAILGSDSTRQITDTSFTSNIDGEELAVTIPSAGSEVIQVSLWAQADITAGAGFIAFEVRANNGSGTQLQAPVDGTGIILVNLAGSRITYFFQVPVTDPDFALTDLFVRCMVRTSSGGTLTIQRARLTAQCLT